MGTGGRTVRLTLVLTDDIAEEIARMSIESLETAGTLLVKLVDSEGQRRLLARRFVPVPADQYELRAVDELVVRSKGYVPALALAEQNGEVAIWFHTHPGVGSAPMPSAYDRQVDRDLAETFRIRTGQEYYGALIASPDDRGGFRFTGHLAGPDGVRPIDRAWVVGDRFTLIPAHDSPRVAPPSQYDRHVRAFGTDIQTALGDLRVGVVGCGGTGSAVVEQLARLGVRDFVLIDPKALTDSNVTRVYGSAASQIGTEKVLLAEANVLRIAPDARCQSIQGDLTMRDVTLEVVGCDVVFGCTDDDAGRLVLSRLSTYLLCPVIDCGVLISSGTDGVIEGIDGRVTVLAPGNACLLCRNRVDTARAATQFLPTSERRVREAEGYAPALGGIEPAVVSFTTAVAAAAVNELLERMIGFGPSPRPSEVLLRFHDREISTNRVMPRDRHYCYRNNGKWGMGLSEPLFDMSWAE